MDYFRLNIELDIYQINNVFQGIYNFCNRKKPPSQKEFLMNIVEKENNSDFTGDMEALLIPEITYNQEAAFEWLKGEWIKKN